MSTLKPPYTVAHENFLSAIWDTSHWIFFSNLDSRHLKTFLGPILVNFKIYQFLATPGPFKYFPKMGAFSFLNEGVAITPFLI